MPGLFASLAQHPSISTDDRFQLRLVGGRGLGGVDLPAGMEQRIVKYQGLPFLVGFFEPQSTEHCQSCNSVRYIVAPCVGMHSSLNVLPAAGVL